VYPQTESFSKDRLDILLFSFCAVVKDFSCLSVKRRVNAYHKIFINNLRLKVHKAPLREEIGLRIVPDEKAGLAEVRIWYKDIFTDVY